MLRLSEYTVKLTKSCILCEADSEFKAEVESRRLRWIESRRGKAEATNVLKPKAEIDQRLRRKLRKLRRLRVAAVSQNAFTSNVTWMDIQMASSKGVAFNTKRMVVLDSSF